MKILMISADPLALLQTSGVCGRLRTYAKGLTWLHVLVPSKITAKKQIGPLTVEGVGGGSLLSRFRMCRYMPEETPDLISAQDPFEFGFAAWCIAKRTHVPFELQVHTDIFSPYFVRHSWKNMLRVRMARFLLPRASRIRVVSERIHQSITQQFSSLDVPIAVVPVSISTGEVLSPDPQPYHIVAVSRLASEKDMPTLLRAFKEVYTRIPKARLSIVGDGPCRGALLQLAESLGISNAVSFVGWVDDPREYYSRAFVFVQTSLFEGYGRSIVEAAIARVPIVTTDVGVVGYELESRGVVVVPFKDPVQLACALTEQLDSPVLPVPPLIVDPKESIRRIHRAWGITTT